MDGHAIVNLFTGADVVNTACHPVGVLTRWTVAMRPEMTAVSVILVALVAASLWAPLRRALRFLRALR